MAKYQAAVLKQGGAQAVSSPSMTQHIISLNITAVATSCVSPPYLCVQPSKLPRLDCSPSSCFSPFFLCPERRGNVGLSLSLSVSLSLIPQGVTPEVPALKSSVLADPKHTPPPQCNGEWTRIHAGRSQMSSLSQPDVFVHFRRERRPRQSTSGESAGSDCECQRSDVCLCKS